MEDNSVRQSISVSTAATIAAACAIAGLSTGAILHSHIQGRRVEQAFRELEAERDAALAKAGSLIEGGHMAPQAVVVEPKHEMQQDGSGVPASKARKARRADSARLAKPVGHPDQETDVDDGSLWVYFFEYRANPFRAKQYFQAHLRNRLAKLKCEIGEIKEAGSPGVGPESKPERAIVSLWPEVRKVLPGYRPANAPGERLGRSFGGRIATANVPFDVALKLNDGDVVIIRVYLRDVIATTTPVQPPNLLSRMLTPCPPVLRADYHSIIELNGKKWPPSPEP